MNAGQTRYRFGIRANLYQFSQQLLQVFFVGLTLGMTRTVVPAMAESEFGVQRGSFMLLMAFVVAFGIVKAALNFVAGALSERLGRRTVLLLGWLTATPIPFLIAYAPTWNWVVAATILLGVNQGLTWSMTQTSKLDLTRPDQRGFTIGLNEFAGYVGVALAGIGTAYLAQHYGVRTGLFVFGVAVIALAVVLTVWAVADTLPWARVEGRGVDNAPGRARPRYPLNIRLRPSTAEVFALVSWRDRRFAAFAQAGLVEKFVDALIWVFYPVFLYQRGLSLPHIGWVVAIYGLVWGIAQLFTGHWSDRVGRRWVIIAGMWICAAGVALMIPATNLLGWSLSALVTGLGMALLYPTLSAAVSDIAHPQWRGSAIGVYRFWRDLGYAIGALALAVVAQLSNSLEAGFWFVSGAMLLSGLIVWRWGEETHPRLNPATP